MNDSSPPHAQFHVLLVEDDEIDVKNVRRAFEKNRILNPLHVARDGEEAVKMLESGEIKAERLLILLDLNMPRMNGIEFLRHIRGDERFKLLPVVVLTTSNDERDRVEAYRLAVAGYIVKPVTFARFVKAMAALNKYWTLVELP